MGLLYITHTYSFYSLRFFSKSTQIPFLLFFNLLSFCGHRSNTSMEHRFFKNGNGMKHVLL